MLGALQKIGEPCQSPFNAGFLTHLYLIRTEELVYVHTPATDTLNQPVSAIGIQPGAVITEFRIRPKTATFAETTSEVADGTIFTSTISLPLKGTATDVTNWRHANGKRRYILLTRDALGSCYMIGSADNGARLSWSRQVGSQSLHQLLFTVVNWHAAQFIPTLDLELLYPNRDFDYSFDISFK